MAKLPFLSVCIPAFEEEESIEKTLNSIFNQTLWKQTPPEKRELLICVNGYNPKTSDRTVQILEQFQIQQPELKIITIAQKGKQRAINMLIKASNHKSREFFFFDADVLVQRNAMQKMLENLHSRRAEVVAANAIASSNLLPEKTVKAPLVAASRFFKEGLYPKIQSDIAGVGYLIKRETAERVKISDSVPASEDYLLTLLVGRKNIYIDPEAKVYYKTSSKYNDKMGQHARAIIGHDWIRKNYPGLIESDVATKRMAQEIREKIARAIIKPAPLKVFVGGAMTAIAKVHGKIRANTILEKMPAIKLGQKFKVQEEEQNKNEKKEVEKNLGFYFFLCSSPTSLIDCSIGITMFPVL